MLIERAVTLHRYMDHRCVTTYSPRDGIVLWELQGQKCQLRVCQHTDVVQTGQGGWMVLIPQWKIVKLKGRSALVIVRTVAHTLERFLLKTVDPTSYTNLITHRFVTSATVVQTEWVAKISRNKRTHRFFLGITYFRDFAKSSFYNNHKFLL